MRRTTEKRLKTALVCWVLGCSMLAGVPKTAAAATQAQYEYDMAEEGEEVYLGVVNRNVLNVRGGASTDFAVIKDATGKIVQLTLKDEVAILGRKYDEKDVWYRVAFLRNGELLQGYVFAEYVDRSSTVVPPIATPTPAVTPTPTPVPTPTKEPVQPTATLPPTTAPTPIPEGTGGKNGTTIALIVVALIVVGGAAAVWYVKNSVGRYDDVGEEAEEEEENVRVRGPLSKDGTMIRTTRRRSDDDAYYEERTRRPRRERQDEASILADKERARLMNEEMIRQYRNGDNSEKEEELRRIAESLKEKEVLRDEIDGLHIGDMVFHEYFGKGIVRDNSDVNVIEISFGQDVRFLNKAACAKKRLLRKL